MKKVKKSGLLESAIQEDIDWGLKDKKNKSNVIKETFGTLKNWKKPTKKILGRR